MDRPPTQPPPDLPDFRCASGLPVGGRPDVEAFLVMAGFAPPRPSLPPPQPLPRHTPMRDRLLEAEQLLHDLEGQPRDTG